MALISPLWTAALRRHWPLVGAVGIFALFLIVDQAWFKPAAKRYEQALEHASEMGLAFDPERASPMMPPRVFALISDNSLPEAVAQEQGNSGALTADLLAELTSAARTHGIEILLTEPGPITQQKQSVQVRAHLRMRCTYREYVGWLDDLARRDKLFSIDRFSLSALPDGQSNVEVWASRYILKRTRENG